MISKTRVQSDKLASAFKEDGPVTEEVHIGMGFEIPDLPFKPLADARGSDQSHDRKGVVCPGVT